MTESTEPFDKTMLSDEEILGFIIKIEALGKSLEEIGEDLNVLSTTKEERSAAYWAKARNMELTIQHLRSAFFEASTRE